MFFKKIIFISFFLLLSIFVILEGMTNDPSFFYKTNISKIIKLYSPIKNDQNIKIIAAYPMTLSNGSNGFPPGYQLLGQMVHNKKFVGGLDVFAPYGQDVYAKIKNISDPNTIDYLINYGVDTILIYDKLLNESDDIIRKLNEDGRLTFLYHQFVQFEDNKYISNNDLANSFYVFRIKKAENVVSYQEIYSDSGRLKILSQSDKGIKIIISEIRPGGNIYFNQPFSNDWKLYEPIKNNFLNLSYLWHNPLLEHTHKINKEYGNVWSFEVEYIKKNVDRKYYSQNSDGSMNIELTIFFKPQAYLYLEWIVSIFTFVVCLIYIIWSWKKSNTR